MKTPQCAHPHFEDREGDLARSAQRISPFVPKIRQFKINPAKIGAVIGPGGKMINGLIEKYALAGIDIEEDGGVFISGMISRKWKKPRPRSAA